ncbi:hypothetical protein SAMN05518801_101177 [Novosphingobium sp. CF614]|uniref:hypothetical protein n=1 Tax=Novosphingobium sp. CF614 TaxID=1884364 RepID=UPI0008F3CC90|nr:hypothetical protein [Novosphingobium sp. CF614]SFF74540.1 hypothetical protein SAMN05518801_101177 [Novosphingobium sp. CF614]
MRKGPWIIALGAIVLFVCNIARFFPNHNGGLGYDYGLFLPWLIGGYFWQSVNGPLVPPEYLPSFCGGVPFLFNPQSVFWSLPQALMAVMPPMASLILSWVTFGLVGAVGMYALVRRVFGVSRVAALLSATIFLLNGFYTTRMIIGHITFHGVMLLPLIALLLFARPLEGVVPKRRYAEVAARCFSAALLLAYLFYSGGTNTILPMMLALTVLALLVAHGGRWHAGIVPLVGIAVMLCVAMCAYKLLPALAFAGNVTRPVSLRMTGNLFDLLGAAGMSLFVPQVLAWLPSERLVLDRVEFEYGVGIVPLVVLAVGLRVAARRGELIRPFTGGRWPLVLAIVLLLAIPILLNWDALGLRWLVLHLPILKMMSVMLRFWFVYVPLLCVLVALLIDYLVPDPARRSMWVSGAMLLTITQAAGTDMSYYADQVYDPAPLIAAHTHVAAGGGVPPIVRIGDPWLVDGRLQPNRSSRNDALVDGISDYPCYEPMFGYRMEMFRQGRLGAGPVHDVKGGLLNLKNPVCYVFPTENSCHPGDEFTAAQRRESQAFSQYRPFGHIWPSKQYVAAWISLAALLLSLGGFAVAAALSCVGRRRTT